MTKKSFTLIELIIVIIIIGILASIALPNFLGMKENALSKEAFANLKLIQAAQKINKMEMGGWVNCVIQAEGASCINNALKLSLPTANPNWYYETSGATGCAQCQRNGDNWRVLHLHIDTEEPESGYCH